MVSTWDVTLPQLTGDEKRKAYLYLPDSYTYDDYRRYPVLYMFDGHNVFFDSHATYGKSWGMKEYMDRTGTPLLIAAVECNHSPDHGRLKEYTPYPFDMGKEKVPAAKGDLTMDWFIHTFKPMIDRNYRTLPDREHTFLAGSSMGGLMSLYAAVRYPSVFSRAAALSPSLWVADGRILDTIRESTDLDGTHIYMDYGSEEFQNHGQIRQLFFRTARELSDKNAFVDCRIVPGGTHCEAIWEKQIPFFMSTFFYDLT